MILRPIVVAFAAVSLVLVACSDSSRPPPSGASGGASGISSGGAGGSDSGAGGDGAADGDGSVEGGSSGLCAAVPQAGDPVVETRIVGSPPAGLGGPVLDGTYVLTERNAYGATPTDEDAGPVDAGLGDIKRATMVIAGATMRISSSRGAQGSPLPPDVTNGMTFTAAGTALATTPVCPTPGPAVNMQYSAVGTGIAIFVDANHRELYARQ